MTADLDPARVSRVAEELAEGRVRSEAGWEPGSYVVDSFYSGDCYLVMNRDTLAASGE